MKSAVFSTLCALGLAGGVANASADEGWSGFYTGLDSGVAQNAVTLSGGSEIPPVGLLMVTPIGDESEVDSFSARFGASSKDEMKRVSGTFVGAHIGYDLQLSNLVFGALADFAIANGADAKFSDNAAIDFNWSASARVRAGWAVNSNWMAYATGGVALAGLNANYMTISGPVHAKSTQTGYGIGAGVEYRLGERMAFQGEYLRQQFRPLSAGDTGAAFKLNTDTFKLSVSLRF